MPEVKIMRSPKRRMRGIDPDAVWVDKDGRTAEITGSDGVKRPLNRENWNKILWHMGDTVWTNRQEYNQLARKLESMGYRHVDNFRKRQGQEPLDPRPSEPELIPNFKYRDDNGSQEPAQKLRRARIYPNEPTNA